MKLIESLISNKICVANKLPIFSISWGEKALIIIFFNMKSGTQPSTVPKTWKIGNLSTPYFLLLMRGSTFNLVPRSDVHNYTRF